MGIRGLYSYVMRKSEEYFEPYTLKNTTIIIDGNSVSYRLFYLSQQNKPKYIIGSDYDVFSRYLTNFFQKLMFHNVNFLIVLNGCFTPARQERCEKKYTSISFDPADSDSFHFTNDDRIHHALFRDDVFLSVIKKLKIKFLKTMFNSSEIISVTSKISGYPILTANSDYFLYGNDCIIFNTIKLDKCTMKLMDNMECKIYRSDKFIKSFPGLNISCLPLLSILMDQDYFNDEILKTILEFESSNDPLIYAHNKIELALNWLSNHTLESACETICSFLTPEGISKQPVKKFIEAHINRYTTFSPLTFKFLTQKHLLSLTEKQITSAKNKFFKFVIDNKKPFPKTYNKLCHKLVERDDDKIKTRIYNLIPNWLSDCHSQGYVPSFIISIIGLRVFIPWYYLEDSDYPSACDMSMPLIELIYRLLLSCIKEDPIQPLNVMLRKDHNFFYKKIEVNRYPTKLETIRKLPVRERSKIINNVLRVADCEYFKDLPENWRLYVATAIFWFKQDIEPKKNKNHLKALLLAMFLNVTKNIIYSKRHQFSNKRHNETIQKSTSMDIFHNNPEDKITTIQAIRKICYSDALIAKNYLSPLVKNQTTIQPSHSCLSTVTIHIYSQFEICLSFSKTLNSLLNSPYHPTIVEKVLIRPLMYNLYLEISQHPDADIYIAEQLRHAPSVLKCFKLLSEKVDLLLDNDKSN